MKDRDRYWYVWLTLVVMLALTSAVGIWSVAK